MKRTNPPSGTKRRTQPRKPPPGRPTDALPRRYVPLWAVRAIECGANTFPRTPFSPFGWLLPSRRGGQIVALQLNSLREQLWTVVWETGGAIARSRQGRAVKCLPVSLWPSSRLKAGNPAGSLPAGGVQLGAFRFTSRYTLVAPSLMIQKKSSRKSRSATRYTTSGTFLENCSWSLLNNGRISCFSQHLARKSTFFLG